MLKEYSNFHLLRILKPEDASGRISHETGIVRKTAKASSSFKDIETSSVVSSKQKYDWFIKLLEPGQIAFGFSEMIYQEFLRMYKPKNPKYRVIIRKNTDRPNDYLIASKAVLDAIPSGTIPIVVMAQNLSVQKISGLGIIVVLALLCNESDLKWGNILVTGPEGNQNLVKIDGDWGFSHLRAPKEYRLYSITPKILQLLPLVDHKGVCPYNWLDIVHQNKLSVYDATFMSWLRGLYLDNDAIRQEIYAQLLAAFLISDEVIDIFVARYFDYCEQKEEFTAIASAIAKTMKEQHYEMCIAANRYDGFVAYVQDLVAKGLDQQPVWLEKTNAVLHFVTTNKIPLLDPSQKVAYQEYLEETKQKLMRDFAPPCLFSPPVATADNVDSINVSGIKIPPGKLSDAMSTDTIPSDPPSIHMVPPQGLSFPDIGLSFHGRS